MSQTVLDQLEQSKQRVERTNIRRNRVQVQLESARQQYVEAQREADALVADMRTKGQHADILDAATQANLDTLRAVLVRKEAENAKAAAEFIRAEGDFDAFITRIENALADPEVMAAVLAAMAPVVAPAPAPAPAAVKPAPAAAVAFDASDI